MTTTRWALVLALSALAMGASSSPPASLPTQLARYRAWHASDVHAVSIPLEMLCVSMTDEELARRRAEGQRTQGPHAERYLRVYANPAAISVVEAAKGFPVGSIVAKEKLLDPYANRVEGVAFMIKHPEGTFSDSGGWEFRYFPERPGA